MYIVLSNKKKVSTCTLKSPISIPLQSPFHSKLHPKHQHMKSCTLTGVVSMHSNFYTYSQKYLHVLTLPIISVKLVSRFDRPNTFQIDTWELQFWLSLYIFRTLKCIFHSKTDLFSSIHLRWCQHTHFHAHCGWLVNHLADTTCLSTYDQCCSVCAYPLINHPQCFAISIYKFYISKWTCLQNAQC